MVSAPAPNTEGYCVFEATLRRGSAKNEFQGRMSTLSGTRFFGLFDEFCEFLALDLGSPQGGELPRAARVQSSYVVKK